MGHGLRHLSSAVGGPSIRFFNLCSISSRRTTFPKKRKRSLCKYSLESTIPTDKAQNETIEAVFVFHRHGDRTPGSSLVADDQANDESEFWKTKIPPSLLYGSLSKKFPAIHQINNNNSGCHSDYESFRESSGGNKSYGFLTWKGLHQMYHQGISVARKYTPIPENAGSFSESWDIRAVSTNYLRTVMSCQAFLDGLLAENNNRAEEIPLDYDHPTHYEENLPWQTNDGAQSIEILVRDAHNETLNAFQSSPTLMKEFVRQVFATPEFMAKDQNQKPLKLELKEYLQGLSKKSAYGGSTPSQKSGDIRINWVSDIRFSLATKYTRNEILRLVYTHVFSSLLDRRRGSFCLSIVALRSAATTLSPSHGNHGRRTRTVFTTRRKNPSAPPAEISFVLFASTALGRNGGSSPPRGGDGNERHCLQLQWWFPTEETISNFQLSRCHHSCSSLRHSGHFSRDFTTTPSMAHVRDLSHV